MTITRRTFLKVNLLFAGYLAGNPILSFAGVVSLRGIPVLTYHDISHNKDHQSLAVSPDAFASQMEWLYSDGWHSLSLSEFEDWLSGDRNIQEKSFMITFDDGYESIMEYAFPLFEYYGFRGVFNIIGGYVGGYLKLNGNRPMLSWDEYRFLKKSGLFDFGCHTSGLHYKKGARSAVLEVSERELMEDLLVFKNKVRMELDYDPYVLAWPYGEYDNNTIKIALKAGYKYLFTSNYGFIGRDMDNAILPRLTVSEGIDLISFQQYVKGV